ncbi:MAG: acetoacetate--CoA ligase [Alphaproteobacteria bacterium]|nr:acetoacetate--CoA ligase [Alphaproteobacteria bacterium]
MTSRAASASPSAAASAAASGTAAGGDAPLWRPSFDRISQSQLTTFMGRLTSKYGVRFSDYEQLWRWSIDHMETFWTELWDFAGVIAETRGTRVLVDGDRMPGAQFFPDARLNFAENLLRRRDQAIAIRFRGEDKVRRALTFAELYDRVGRLAQALRALGVEPGDRVAGYLPNMPEAVIGMLATAAVGGVWSSASPDFGVQGVLDRFGQIEPKVLITADGYFYGGKTLDIRGKVTEILAGLPSVVRTIVVPYTTATPDIAGVPDAVLLDDVLAGYPAADIEFARMPFNHPLYIMFSSGTTGVPKCIVHGAGGTLIQHLKEHRLHCDVAEGDRVFYFTTLGWMMWNWVVSALACEASLLLYDGSPFYPSGNVLFDFADAEGMTLFGTSAKFIDALNKQGYRPIDTHSLETLRTMTSTGSPLAPESFDYVYDGIKADIHLASISGGTDLLSCFALGNPISPVWRGELQCRGLAMATDVFDEEGRPVREQKGELVCTRPFPPMPLYFWNDPTGEKYFNAYFARFPNTWCHGDFVELTKHNGMIIHGRSDATLNPGGVRIGTSEIYRVVEQLPEVVESLVIGQDWDNDVRVVLFVVLREGTELTAELEKRIKQQIRDGASPRHIPAKVVAVNDIPRTKSGKITELAVRDIVHGRPVKNREALANPDALDFFRNRAELAE